MRVITIGVYGWSEQAFFTALLAEKVDVFCDIRARRAVRGSAYAFANATRLQRRLDDLGVRYLYVRDLAPSPVTRTVQRVDDQSQGIKKRSRQVLGSEFVEAYVNERLRNFDADRFLEGLGLGVRSLVLLCVEQQPTACHRSLVAAKLAENSMVEVKHLTP